MINLVKWNKKYVEKEEPQINEKHSPPWEPSPICKGQELFKEGKNNFSVSSFTATGLLCLLSALRATVLCGRVNCHKKLVNRKIGAYINTTNKDFLNKRVYMWWIIIADFKMSNITIIKILNVIFWHYLQVWSAFQRLGFLTRQILYKPILKHAFVHILEFNKSATYGTIYGIFYTYVTRKMQWKNIKHSLLNCTPAKFYFYISVEWHYLLHYEIYSNLSN